VRWALDTVGTKPPQGPATAGAPPPQVQAALSVLGLLSNEIHFTATSGNLLLPFRSGSASPSRQLLPQEILLRFLVA
jgi:hypothetical protein